MKQEAVQVESKDLVKDGELTEYAVNEIKDNVARLTKERKAKKVFPIVVFGDKQQGEKEVYIGYFAQPSFPQFSKFMTASKKDELTAIHQLAKDVFLDGDIEMVNDDSLFLYGAMGQVHQVMSTRTSILVNL